MVEGDESSSQNQSAPLKHVNRKVVIDLKALGLTSSRAKPIGDIADISKVLLRVDSNGVSIIKGLAMTHTGEGVYQGTATELPLDTPLVFTVEAFDLQGRILLTNSITHTLNENSSQIDVPLYFADDGTGLTLAPIVESVGFPSAISVNTSIIVEISMLDSIPFDSIAVTGKEDGILYPTYSLTDNTQAFQWNTPATAGQSVFTIVVKNGVAESKTSITLTATTPLGAVSVAPTIMPVVTGYSTEWSGNLLNLQPEVQSDSRHDLLYRWQYRDSEEIIATSANITLVANETGGFARDLTLTLCYPEYREEEVVEVVLLSALSQTSFRATTPTLSTVIGYLDLVSDTDVAASHVAIVNAFLYSANVIVESYGLNNAGSELISQVPNSTHAGMVLYNVERAYAHMLSPKYVSGNGFYWQSGQQLLGEVFSNFMASGTSYAGSTIYTIRSVAQQYAEGVNTSREIAWRERIYDQWWTISGSGLEPMMLGGEDNEDIALKVFSEGPCNHRTGTTNYYNVDRNSSTQNVHVYTRPYIKEIDEFNKEMLEYFPEEEEDWPLYTFASTALSGNASPAATALVTPGTAFVYSHNPVESDFTLYCHSGNMTVISGDNSEVYLETGHALRCDYTSGAMLERLKYSGK